MTNTVHAAITAGLAVAVLVLGWMVVDLRAEVKGLWDTQIESFTTVKKGFDDSAEDIARLRRELDAK